MTDAQKVRLADEIHSVGAIYKEKAVAGSYLEKRLQFSWQRLLHEKQVGALNRTIDAHHPSILELAPGPARLSVLLEGVKRGVMVENSEEMIEIARRRLAERGLEAAWKVIRGNAFELDRIFPTDTFDFAYTFRFIRHFREAERMRLYELLRGRLSAGGLLMFDVVNAPTRNAIETRIKTRSPEEIAIYDVSYTAEEFVGEMKNNGFRVVSMEPVIARFVLQSWISYKLDDVVPGLASGAVRLLEKIPAQHPLEWVAVCQRM
jgi:SAM-dependent methyltransferase